MSQNDQADRNSSPQAFGFHQLRQACEISSLRQEITRILAGTADLQILIENEVERVRLCLGALDAAESLDPARLSPLLSDAMASLIEIRDASRRLETTLARRSPAYGPGWYAMMMGIVFVVSTGLFLLALMVFGRLEGNFAEEL